VSLPSRLIVYDNDDDDDVMMVMMMMMMVMMMMIMIPYLMLMGSTMTSLGKVHATR